MFVPARALRLRFTRPIDGWHPTCFIAHWGRHHWPGILGPHLINCVTLSKSQPLQALLSSSVKWNNKSHFCRVLMRIKDNVCKALNSLWRIVGAMNINYCYQQQHSEYHASNFIHTKKLFYDLLIICFVNQLCFAWKKVILKNRNFLLMRLDKVISSRSVSPV